MKKIFIIGIGAGNPEYITIQAINALNKVNVFFLMEKNKQKEKLITLRKEIIQRYVDKDRTYRIVCTMTPECTFSEKDYVTSVQTLNCDKQYVFENLISKELSDGECGAFLIWGDPSLYDSTTRIIDTISQIEQHTIKYEVIPGISSVQALAARHRISLNEIGQPIEIKNGRTLIEDFSNNASSIVVMLDANNAFHKVINNDFDIYWGAYVGTPDEILVSGKLSDIAEDITRIRANARERYGWIMDSYILKKRKHIKKV
ncbi:MAG: precorrin-6A synthase (deacetylating) [Burkholderia sp.]|nr:precorrin-6A synthase (deacetylating) [Burkholderia sp.]